MTAFYGSGATPPMRHGSPFAQARSPLVPLCAAPCVCATAPGGKPSGHRGDVGPEGRPPFVGHIFRACAKPGTGPDLRPSRHASQHTMPESGALPGAPAGPGSFSVTAEKIWVFPSFGNSFGVPHPGILCLSCARSRMRPWLPVNRPDGSSALDPLMDVLHMQCVSSRKTTSLRAIIV